MNRTEHAVGKFIVEQVLRGSANTEIAPDRRLLEEGVLDSLGLQQLVTFLESEYSMEFIDDYLVPENFESIRAIADFIDSSRE